MILSLLWKEYREYRWPVLLCTPALCVLDKICRSSPALVNGEILLMLLPTIVLAVFIVSHVVAGERAGRTHLTLAALPISRGGMAAIRILSGLMALLLPLLVLYVFARATPSVFDHWPRDGILNATPLFTSALGVYAWTLILAARSRTRAGVVVYSMIVLCSALLGNIMLEGESSWQAQDLLVFDLVPVLVNVRQSFSDSAAAHAAERIATLLLVLLYAGIRIALLSSVGGIAKARRVSVNASHTAVRIRARSTLLPLTWKAYREIRNLALLAIAVNMFFALCMTTFTVVTALHRSTVNREFLRDFASYLVVPANFIWIVIGSIMVIAIGIRITESAFRPKAADFWQSRPVNPLRYLESQAVAGFLALATGTLAFVALAYLLPPIYPTLRDEALNSAENAFFIQFLMFPITLFIGSIARNALTTAAVSSALLVALMVAAVFASSTSGGTHQMASIASATALLLFLGVPFLWRWQLKHFPFARDSQRATMPST